MNAIREIEESNSNKKTTARVIMQQEIEGETDGKGYSTDDESMGSATHIQKTTGVDNSDTESMLTDKKEENGSNGDGDESMGSTDEELLNIEENKRKQKGG